MSNSTTVCPVDFNKECKGVIDKFVDVHDNATEFVNADEDHSLFVLRNSQCPIVAVNRSEFYLLKVKSSEGLYLHFSVKYKPNDFSKKGEKEKATFEGASLQFFSEKSNLICRAEWDVKSEDRKINHPQPHWHIPHWSVDRGEGQSFESDHSEAEQFNQGFLQELVVEAQHHLPPKIDFGEMHFAMSAQWHKYPVVTNSDFSPQGFFGWLRNCLISVIDQYNYQSGKKSFTSVGR